MEELERLRLQNNTELFRQQALEAKERGVDVDSIIEGTSTEYDLNKVKIGGVKMGIQVIAISYLGIIGSQIIGGFTNHKIDVDAVFITATATAMAGLLGFVLGKKKS